MKRIRLISASFGDHQKESSLKQTLSYKDYLIDPIFYHDGNTKSRINSLHPRLKSKIPKMMEWLVHPDYDFYIWYDANFEPGKDFLENMFQFGDKADLFLFKHPERSSIREELHFMEENMKNGNRYLLQRYAGESVDKQAALYLSDESFVDDQLFSLGCFMYSSNLVKNRNYNLMTDWLLHNLLYSTQDQLSLPYLLHKHQVNYKIYPGHILNLDYLTYNFS